MKKLLFALAIVAVVFAAKPNHAVAGPVCSMTCWPCSTWGLPGAASYDYTTNPAASHYGYYACAINNFCAACGSGGDEERISANPEADFTNRIRTGSWSVLRRTLNKDVKLFVSASRNIVVVQGTKCDPKALAAVVFVTPERAAELRRMGVASLETAAATTVASR